MNNDRVKFPTDTITKVIEENQWKGVMEKASLDY